MKIHVRRSDERGVTVGRGIVQELTVAMVVIFRFDDHRGCFAKCVEQQRERGGLAAGVRHYDSPGVNRVVRQTFVGHGEIGVRPGDVQVAADIDSIQEQQNARGWNRAGS